MVEPSNNYINLVVLGNFNPAILTPDFLYKVCDFHFGSEPSVNPQEVLPGMPPVVASLVCGDVSFQVDLGRLQIAEKNCKDPRSSQLPAYLDVYLKKLPYTPISVCGANLNYNMIVEKAKLDTIEEWLKNNRTKFCETLQVDAVNLEASFSIEKKEEKIKKWLLRTAISEHNATIRINVSYVSDSENTVKINFNYEVPNLDRDRNLLTSITTDYSKIVDLCEHYLGKIFAE